MQRALLGAAIALILVLVTALVGPLFVDWGRYRETFENNIHLSRGYKDALSERVARIRERYGLAGGHIEYRPELWAEEEQLELFPL